MQDLEKYEKQRQLESLPLKPPRYAQGAEADQRWQISRDQPPTASFIDALRGNDATFEVIVGQGRLLTIKGEIAKREGTAVVAVGDPSVIEFQFLPNNPRMVRIIGQRIGVTDFSITTVEGQTYSFEVHVVYDLTQLSAQLREAFPGATLRLAQLREHLIVEGEAPSQDQSNKIVQTLEAFLASAQIEREVEEERGGAAPRPGRAATKPAQPAPEQGVPGKAFPADLMAEEPGEPDTAMLEPGGRQRIKVKWPAARVINLIRVTAVGQPPEQSEEPPPAVISRVPGVHQVLLQVRMAELNRTALREIGADILGVDSSNGNLFGTQIAGAAVGAAGTGGAGGLGGSATLGNSNTTTAFGIFPTGSFEVMLRALRRNSVLSILAEPNLMAMSGHRASFVAGGEFPVPIPQSGAGGGGATYTIVFKEFGVILDFVPYVLEDGLIRLSVTPEVSTIDESIGVTLTPGGTPVPGLNTRKATTTVELKQGQTLAMAGLLLVSIDAQTSRIPGLGDLPYIGVMFSNTTHRRVEKELIVLVTPYLVTPMNPDQVPALPGCEIKDPNDLEFYLLNRIEARTGRDTPSTRTWDNPGDIVRRMKLEQRCVSGPVGHSE